MANYISVSEFARRAKVSRQTVYNKLSNELSKFVKEVDSKKLIDEAGLAIFLSNEVSSETSSERPNLTGNLTDNLTSMIESLQRQIEVKDRQIEQKDKQIETLAEALKTTQLQLSTQQALQAGTLQLLAEKPTEEEKGASHTVEPAEPITEDKPAEQTENIEQKTQRGFFSRIFKKNKRG